MMLAVLALSFHACASETDSIALLQSRSQTVAAQNGVSHSHSHLEAAATRKARPSYSGSPTVVTDASLNGCEGTPLTRGITSLDECKEVAAVHSMKFHKADSWTDRPAGCFKSDASSGKFKARRVYWNDNAGAAHFGSRPICKAPICDFYECPQNHIKKSTQGPDWTLNPSPERCCDALCTVPSAPGYDLTAAGGVLKMTAFAPTALNCAEGHVGSVVATACVSAGTAYTVSGCQGECTTPSKIGYDFAAAEGAVTIVGFGPTGLSCASGYTGSVTTSVCLAHGAAYSVTGCEPTCAAHKCSAGHLAKGGVQSTTNPSDAVCCDAVCAEPSTPGYNFAESAGVLKMTGFAPTALTCASDYVGSAISSVCPSPGAAYSVTGCEPTCAAYKCSVGHLAKGGVESTTNASDAVCCDATCAEPLTPGYNYAASAGVLKITGFARTGLTCASGYVGSATSSVCSSPGAAYSVTGCKPTCSAVQCGDYAIARPSQADTQIDDDSNTQTDDDSVCCQLICTSTTVSPDFRRLSGTWVQCLDACRSDSSCTSVDIQEASLQDSNLIGQCTLASDEWFGWRKEYADGWGSLQVRAVSGGRLHRYCPPGSTIGR